VLPDVTPNKGRHYFPFVIFLLVSIRPIVSNERMVLRTTSALFVGSRMNRNLLPTIRAIHRVRQLISDLREKLPPEEISPEHLDEIDVIMTWALARCDAIPEFEPTAIQVRERQSPE
jgi:hypothetical protein